MSSIVVTGRIPASPARTVSSRAAGSRTRGSRPLRLTRRGRVVVRLLLAALVVTAVAVGVLATSGVASAGRDARPAVVTTHVVLPGETLWELAERVAPGSDPRDVVARIVELNGLEGAGVRAGTRLVLPVME